MPEAGESLFWIALCAVLGPLLAGLVLRHRVPEVVLLLVLGVVIGPNVLELAGAGEGVTMLRELGLGMLFLLAGYEIELAELTGRAGRRALVTWVACLLLAMALVALLGSTGLVFVATATGGGFDRRESAAVALFASTGLPIVVAVTSVAVSAGEMSTTNASVLVAGGAVTVLVCPLLGQRLLARGHPDRVSPGTTPPA